MKTPSVKTLGRIADDAAHARRLKAILTASRAALETMPGADERVRECYHPPTTQDLRLHALNHALNGYGVEAFAVKGGGYCEYVNLGDPYVETIVRLPGGRYRVACWGDIVEKHT